MLKISKDVLVKTNEFFIPKRSPEIKRNGCVKKEMRNLEYIKFMFEKDLCLFNLLRVYTLDQKENDICIC